MESASKGNEHKSSPKIHEAFSVGYYVKCSYNNDLSYYRSYHDENPAKWFTQELIVLAAKVEETLGNIISMTPLTATQKDDFKKADQCHLREKLFKVCDHYHLTGQYRGAAHQGCNINYQDPKIIPIVFHNLSKYDAHLII